jgi:hypothetical protein
MVSRNCVVDLTRSGLDVKIVSSRSTNCLCPMLATERLMSGTVIECGAHFVFRQAISPTHAATGLSLSRCAHLSDSTIRQPYTDQRGPRPPHRTPTLMRVALIRE